MKLCKHGFYLPDNIMLSELICQGIVQCRCCTYSGNLQNICFRHIVFISSRMLLHLMYFSMTLLGIGNY